jgi:hypothetical protein
MRCRLREYDDAMNDVAGRVLAGFVGAHPVLGRIERQRTPHAGPTRNVRVPQVLDQSPERLEAVAHIKKADVRECNVDAHSAFLAELADQHVSAAARMLYRAADAVTTATGMTQDAGGQPLTWDVILDMVERMPITFNSDGSPNLPEVVAHPDTISKLAPITSAQLARQDEILRKKKEEYVAAKRTRRLPR